MSNFKNFNRYEAFNETIFDVFSSFFKDYSNWKFNEECNGKDCGSLTNKLYGIYDGFLYDGLVDEAKELGVPSHLVELLEAVVEYTESWIEIKGEVSEDEIHAINLGLV